MKKHLTSILFLIVLFSACQKEGEQITKRSTLPSFNTIQLNDFFDVFLTEDSSFQIEITAHEDLINKIDFQVINEELVINNDKKLKWTDPQNNKVTLRISSIGLKEVHANETCNIQSVNPITTREFGIILKSKANFANLQFNNETVYYWNNHPCGGRLTLSGTTNELKLWNTAIMSVDAANLICTKALVENSSKGNCTVNVSQELKYSLDGEGDIIVYGNPTEILEESNTSSGELILR